MILWVGICIRFESSVIVKLRVFCTVSSENSDVFWTVAVSKGFACCISETRGNDGYSGCSWWGSGFWKRLVRSSCSDCSESCLVYKRSTLEVCSSGVISGEVLDVVKGRLSDVSECSTKKLWSKFVCSKCVTLNDVCTVDVYFHFLWCMVRVLWVLVFEGRYSRLVDLFVPKVIDS